MGVEGLGTQELLPLPHRGDAASFSTEVVGADPAAAKASPRQITLNLITGGFGLGIFSLPWSLAGASLIPGIVIIVLVVVLNAWTVRILIEGAERHQAFDLGALLSHLPGGVGRPAHICTNVAVWGVLMITQVGYVNIMADAFLSIVPAGSAADQRPFAVVAVSVLMLPICFLDQRYLNFTSLLAVVVNVYIFGVMVAQPNQSEGICLVGAGQGTLAMVSVMAQAIVIQMCVLPMYAEMEDRTPAKFHRAVSFGFGSLILIFVAFAAVGYLTFGHRVQGNILDMFPHDVYGNAARVGAGICIAGVYPIFEQAMVAPVWNSQVRHRRLLYVLATIATVAISMLGAMRFRSVGFINEVDGAICAAVFVSLCPGAVGLFLLDRRSFRWRVAMCIFITFGVAAGVLGLLFTDSSSKYEEVIDHHCVLRA